MAWSPSTSVPPRTPLSGSPAGSPTLVWGSYLKVFTGVPFAWNMLPPDLLNCSLTPSDLGFSWPFYWQLSAAFLLPTPLPFFLPVLWISKALITFSHLIWFNLFAYFLSSTPFHPSLNISSKQAGDFFFLCFIHFLMPTVKTRRRAPIDICK